METKSNNSVSLSSAYLKKFATRTDSNGAFQTTNNVFMKLTSCFRRTGRCVLAFTVKLPLM